MVSDHKIRNIKHLRKKKYFLTFYETAKVQT